MRNVPLSLRAAALALVPMTCAIAGAWIDERTHLGYSIWRSACRSAGLSVESLISFTFDLLPAALIGALSGALLLQFVAAVTWRRVGARVALASHAGCAAGMAAGSLLCVVLPSIPLMLATELLVTMAVAAIACNRQGGGECTASVVLPTLRPPHAY
jgi:hypothetical protein